MKHFLWVVHYSALTTTMSSGKSEWVSVRKQTGPQRVHKSRDTKFILYIWIPRIRWLHRLTIF